MKTSLSVAVMCVLLPSVAPAPAAGQSGPPQPVTWALTLAQPATTIKAGGAFEALVTVTIDEGWHVYASDEVPDGPRPLLITRAEESPFCTGGPLKAPDAERDMDEAFGHGIFDMAAYEAFLGGKMTNAS